LKSKILLLLKGNKEIVFLFIMFIIYSILKKNSRGIGLVFKEKPGRHGLDPPANFCR